ncbi:hypothetical protein GCM10010912_43440 [Paenibacillus albidus]|uniref:Zinc ribbon domain-containing protein n=1 Tax=Paenibacillus albidus TaxID=2041023 RepID=A0A917CNA3_9BACL|nr:zinc ribbon domain-containing protein [Paenibacillus albidus]GGF93791.1 hypothetical protein GCM10010912_43440 [Paenibacillus albidus]
MNLLQRIKDGASKVTEKAQNSVEIGKLNSHISDIEREMEVEFAKMGKLFYEGYRSRDMSVAEGQMLELSRACSKLQEKIDGLRSRIAELKNERLCSCGYVVALDANFCPHCGRRLEEPLNFRKTPAAPVTVASVYEDEEEDQYYGADELTAEEKELAMKSEQHAVYTEVQESEDELPLDPYAGGQEVDRDRRHADELERERERQLELDRRIRDWKASEHGEEASAAEGEDNGVRDLVKCQICRADLPKGSMWCPRCGSEQI